MPIAAPARGRPRQGSRTRDARPYSPTARRSQSEEQEQDELSETDSEREDMGSSTRANDADGTRPRRTRTLMNQQQLTILHALLAQTRFPTTAQREEAARQTALTPRKVQVWFQNQRQKQNDAARRANTQGLPLYSANSGSQWRAGPAAGYQANLGSAPYNNNTSTIIPSSTTAEQQQQQQFQQQQQQVPSSRSQYRQSSGGAPVPLDYPMRSMTPDSHSQQRQQQSSRPPTTGPPSTSTSTSSPPTTGYSRRRYDSVTYDSRGSVSSQQHSRSSSSSQQTRVGQSPLYLPASGASSTTVAAAVPPLPATTAEDYRLRSGMYPPTSGSGSGAVGGGRSSSSSTSERILLPPLRTASAMGDARSRSSRSNNPALPPPFTLEPRPMWNAASSSSGAVTDAERGRSGSDPLRSFDELNIRGGSSSGRSGLSTSVLSAVPPTIRGQHQQHQHPLAQSSSSSGERERTGHHSRRQSLQAGYAPPAFAAGAIPPVPPIPVLAPMAPAGAGISRSSTPGPYGNPYQAGGAPPPASSPPAMRRLWHRLGGKS